MDRTRGMPRLVIAILLVGLLFGCKKEPTVIESELTQDQVRTMLGKPQFLTEDERGRTVWVYDHIGVDDYPMVRRSDTGGTPRRRLLLKLAASPFPPSNPDPEPGQYAVRLRLVFGPDQRLESFTHQVKKDYGPGLDRSIP